MNRLQVINSIMNRPENSSLRRCIYHFTIITSKSISQLEVSRFMGVPHSWKVFLLENPTKMDDLGLPPWLRKAPRCPRPHWAAFPCCYRGPTRPVACTVSSSGSCSKVYKRRFLATRWCPPVISWLIITLTIDISTMAVLVIGVTNQLSYLGGTIL